MTVENISLSISINKWDQAGDKLMTLDLQSNLLPFGLQDLVYSNETILILCKEHLGIAFITFS